MMLSALRQHYASTLKSYNHPHTFDIHVMFLRPVVAGKVLVTIDHVKLGRKTSTVHVALSQEGTDRVVGHVS